MQVPRRKPPGKKFHPLLQETSLSEFLVGEWGAEDYLPGLTRNLTEFFGVEPSIFLFCGEKPAERHSSVGQEQEPAAAVARQVLASGVPLRSTSGDVLAAPIPLGKEAAAGALLVTCPAGVPGSDQKFLLLQVLALLAGRSLENCRLKRLLQLRLLQCGFGPRQTSQAEAFPEPAKVARLVAKSFYNELSRAGFTAEHIIDAATEILTQLEARVKRHSRRCPRQSQSDPSGALD